MMKNRRFLTNHADDDGGHYWISISDLMTSLLFIFIIILAYTIFTYKQKSDAFEKNYQCRSDILSNMERDLAKEGVNVEVDIKDGSMRIRSDTFFNVGSADLSQNGIESLNKISKEIIVQLSNDECKDSIDTIFIEGHTDNTPLVGTNYNRRWTNMELSAQRAINSFLAMDQKNNIAQLKNKKSKQLFSYSGYADTRPVASNQTVEGKAKNRRIEFFFALSSAELSK